jgi:ribose 5-phosphate isomerase
MEQLLASILSHDYIGVGNGPIIQIILDRLAQKQPECKPVLVCVSKELAAYALSLGFHVQSWRGAREFELFIDQVDYVSEQGFYSFGSDGLMKERKIVASLARQLCVITAQKSYVHALTEQDFYAEVLPQASSIAAQACLKIGVSLNYIDKQTQDNQWLMEMRIKSPWDYAKKIEQLNAIPGMLAHGLSARSATAVYYDEQESEGCLLIKV